MNGVDLENSVIVLQDECQRRVLRVVGEFADWSEIDVVSWTICYGHFQDDGFRRLNQNPKPTKENIPLDWCECVSINGMVLH